MWQSFFFSHNEEFSWISIQLSEDALFGRRKCTEEKKGVCLPCSTQSTQSNPKTRATYPMQSPISSFHFLSIRKVQKNLINIVTEQNSKRKRYLNRWTRNVFSLNFFWCFIVETAIVRFDCWCNHSYTHKSAQNTSFFFLCLSRLCAEQCRVAFKAT